MPENNKKLRFAVRKFGPFEAALEKAWEAYCNETGCTWQLEPVPMDLHELHEATLGNSGLLRGDWDIAHLNTDWVAEAHAKGAIADLVPFIQKDSPEEFPAGWSDALLQMQQFGEQVVGLPFHDGPECLIYRKDLFEDPTEKENYRSQFGKELAPPTTWDDFVTIARFFQRPEQGLYGSLFAAYPDGHNTVFDFCLQLWTRGGELVDADGNINIDTPAAQEGLTFYRAILKDKTAVHPSCAEFESVGAGQAFARGEVAMMVNWFGFAAVCEVDPTAKVKGNVDIADIPHGPTGKGTSLNVYWMYTIGEGSTKKDIAYDFIKFATNRENDKLLTLSGGIGCRISTWHDPEINRMVPYYHKLEELHKNSRTLPRHADWSRAAAIIDQVVLRAVQTEEPIAYILQQGQQQLNQLFS
ncbi:extracellular solute-binding protein [Pontibacter qinzhouensis]|uniref:Extracellular solute-binding protein n=1 Tax=Pontibacter qinzhouensis TaxID=2603253 RepID=A0A5C8J459_9BACT|nr:extracellular solute-binding protein [Pontibacter qinzhouensis]TXK31108.1 extracellular solute-binding protein [Pontibacter qinzhouensis]